MQALNHFKYFFTYVGKKTVDILNTPLQKIHKKVQLRLQILSYVYAQNFAQKIIYYSIIKQLKLKKSNKLGRFLQTIFACSKSCCFFISNIFLEVLIKKEVGLKNFATKNTGKEVK